jgi:flagellar hook-associated protein 1 FlgK
MSNIMAGLIESANALSAFDQVLQVTQNNVANASTPGFAKQSLQLTAEPFQLPGLLGGVVAGTIQSSRDEFAEQAVRQQTTVLGQQQQLATSLTSLQSVMDVSGNTGIPYALNKFFQSVSAWSQTPSDEAARQTVIARAGDVAQAIRDASAALVQVGQDTDTQTRSTVNQVNQLVAQIQAYNPKFSRPVPAPMTAAWMPAFTPPWSNCRAWSISPPRNNPTALPPFC